MTKKKIHNIVNDNFAHKPGGLLVFWRTDTKFRKDTES